MTQTSREPIRWTQALLGCAVFLVLGFALACGGAAAPQPSAPAPPAAAAPKPPAPAPAAAVKPAWQKEWEAVVAAAKQEGQLVAAVGGTATRQYRPLYELFGEKFGIKVVFSGGSGTEIGNRVLAERSGGIYAVDVLSTGATTGNLRLIPAGALDPIEPYLLLPEVTDKALWHGGRHSYADPQQKYQLIFSSTVTPEVLEMRYNKNLVTPADLAAFNSVFDYLAPKWKGKIVAISPVHGGGGVVYFTAYVHPDIGPKWVKAFIEEMDVFFTEDFRLIADGIARGKFAMGIAIGAAGTDIDKLGEQGLPVARLIKPLKERGVLSGQGSGNIIAVANRAPHPNATKLFVNWFLSREGQTAVHEKSAAVSVDPSLRDDDIPWGKTRPEDRRVKGASYYSLDADPAVTARREEAIEYARKVYRESRK